MGYNGVHLNTLNGHSDTVHSAAFSPTDACISSALYDATPGMWNVVSGAYLDIFEGHFSFVLFAAFSPDGMRIVSGSSDNNRGAVSDLHLDTVGDMLALFI